MVRAKPTVFMAPPGWEPVAVPPAGASPPRMWWLSLVRVGTPEGRGQGYGTRALRDVVGVLTRLLGATAIGLHPHGLGHTRDLTPWYRREGFTVEDGEYLWWVRQPVGQLNGGGHGEGGVAMYSNMSSRSSGPSGERS